VKIVFPGARLEYGRPASIPVREEDELDPLCVHAVHKMAVEQYLKIYGRLYGVRSTILRITNPYGPGQPPGRTAYGIVNRMIQLALDDEALPVFGDGSQRRDYLYIQDLVDAFLGVGVEAATDGRYNVGAGSGPR
jgi:nucleoside-diphosphate-sugar epimerase